MLVIYAGSAARVNYRPNLGRAARTSPASLTRLEPEQRHVCLTMPTGARSTRCATSVTSSLTAVAQAHATRRYDDALAGIGAALECVAMLSDAIGEDSDNQPDEWGLVSDVARQVAENLRQAAAGLCPPSAHRDHARNP